jgi:predicted phage terminase large subunit-like protein
MTSLSPEEIERLLLALPSLPKDEQEALLADLERLESQRALQHCRDDFLAFCHKVYPGFKEGPHHRFLKPLLHNICHGDEKRLTVSMPPRFGKSESIAYLFVAWYLGHHPQHHIIMTTHTAELSAGFGRKIRDLIDSPVYQEIFPQTFVAKDKSSAAHWLTSVGGKYLAIGIGANVAGHGAHLLIADDLVSENAMLANPDAAFETAWTYMQVGPLQRLMPGGRIVMIGTRWGKKDPIGRALQWAQDNPTSPQWTEVRFPAILPSGKSLWPEQWPLEQLQAKKASMQSMYWAAQYMQTPTSEEGALIKREWWKIWEKPDPPDVEFVIQTWDTAHEAKNTADFSACTTWGVWTDAEDKSNLIMLNAVKGRWEFPELKKEVLEQWRQWKPEAFVIEKKASGAPLIQELRRMNISVQEYTPSRKGAGVSNDKRARVNAVADIFFSGRVWVPDKRWAHEVIDEVAEFPNGQNDDYVDTVTMAVSRYRTGGFIRLDTDYDADRESVRPRRAAYY